MYNVLDTELSKLENSTHLKLNSSWKLWFHSPENKSWDIDSYVLVCEIFDIHGFWNIFSQFTPNQIQYGMFFLMRENIKPTWEDVNNINGGCWSFKVSKKETYETWIELCIAAVGEIITNEYIDTLTINGVTISPKKNFSIIKIWNNDKNKNTTDLLSSNIPNISLDESLYNAHEDKS